MTRFFGVAALLAAGLATSATGILPSRAQPPASPPPRATRADQAGTAVATPIADRVDFDHAAWDTLLRASVDDAGRVAYRDLQTKSRSALALYIAALGAAEPDAWPQEEQLAFWINAYNAGMLWAIVLGESPESLLGRAHLFKSWSFRVAGRDRTPDAIEHEILRKRFAEPRIHFALVCAATSCPRLRREAYTGARLAAQLDEEARRFIQDSSRNRIEAAAGRLEVSAIFDWFRGDFEAAAGSVPAFLARYVETGPEQRWLAGNPGNIRYVDYDWTLNAQPGQRPER